MLRISEKTFNRLYPDLEGYYDFFNNPVPSDISKEDFERIYLPSKLWRLNNLYFITDKQGKKVRFRMTQEQIGVFADEVCQSLQLSRTEVPMQAAAGRFQAERDGWCELSGWMARHPEFLS